MRVLYFLFLMLILGPLYADDSGDDGFPSTNNSNMPNPTSPYANSSTTSPNSPSSSSSGGDAFGSMVQQQTNQAIQTFQNVNYQKLSGNESQNDFFSDDSSDANSADPSHLFTVFSSSDNSGSN